MIYNYLLEQIDIISQEWTPHLNINKGVSASSFCAYVCARVRFAYRQYLFEATAHKFIPNVQPQVQLVGRCHQSVDELHACHL